MQLSDMQLGQRVCFNYPGRRRPYATGYISDIKGDMIRVRWVYQTYKVHEGVYDKALLKLDLNGVEIMLELV